jgi:hypothetical protein
MFEQLGQPPDMIRPSFATQRPRQAAARTRARLEKLKLPVRNRSAPYRAPSTAQTIVSPPARHRSQPSFLVSQIRGSLASFLGGGFILVTHLHAQAGSIECRCRLPSSDKSEHKPIGSSKKKPAQSAPFMTSGGTVGENMIVNRARTSPMAIVMPKAAVRNALKSVGKPRGRYPSRSPVIDDTGKVSRKDVIAHIPMKLSSIRPAMAAATIHTASATSEGPSRRKATGRFIEVDPSFKSSEAKPGCSDFSIMPGRRRTADAETPAACLRQHRATGYAALETRQP